MRGFLIINDDEKDKYFDACFNAYWKNNIDVSKDENIKKILNDCEISYDLFYNGIKDQNIKDKLKNLTNSAFSKDVFGAPTFIINNKIFWGQDRLDYAIDEYNS